MSAIDTAHEVLSWELFGIAAEDLAHQIRADGFLPDLVLSVARGGLGLGMALGYALDVKALATINVEFYTGIDARLDEPVLIPPIPSSVELGGRRVLIVDDVADTGRTLEVVQGHCGARAADMRTAVVYEKPMTTVRPDYRWRTTEAWIDFPWSS